MDHFVPLLASTRSATVGGRAAAPAAAAGRARQYQKDAQLHPLQQQDAQLLRKSQRVRTPARNSRAVPFCAAARTERRSRQERLEASTGPVLRCAPLVSTGQLPAELHLQQNRAATADGTRSCNRCSGCNSCNSRTRSCAPRALVRDRHVRHRTSLAWEIVRMQRCCSSCCN